MPSKFHENLVYCGTVACFYAYSAGYSKFPFNSKGIIILVILCFPLSSFRLCVCVCVCVCVCILCGCGCVLTRCSSGVSGDFSAEP